MEKFFDDRIALLSQRRERAERTRRERWRWALRGESSTNLTGHDALDGRAENVITEVSVVDADVKAIEANQHVESELLTCARTRMRRTNVVVIDTLRNEIRFFTWLERIRLLREHSRHVLGGPELPVDLRVADNLRPFAEHHVHVEGDFVCVVVAQQVERKILGIVSDLAADDDDMTELKSRMKAADKLHHSRLVSRTKLSCIER